MYVTVGKALVIVDADSLRLLGVRPLRWAADNLRRPYCVLGDTLLYVTERVHRFNRRAMAWATDVSGAYMSVGITGSRAAPNLLFVGESHSGGIGVIDRLTSARIREVGVPKAQRGEFAFSLVALEGDSKIYQSRYNEGGLLAVAPSSGLFRRVSLGGGGWRGLGRADAMVLSPDDSRLYVAVLDGDPRGIAVVDTRTDTVIERMAIENGVPQEVALSPNGRRLFVTTQDRWAGVPSDNLLIDTQSLRVLARLQRSRPDGWLRRDGGVAFAPNGKLVFLAHDTAIDVFIHREDFP